MARRDRPGPAGLGLPWPGEVWRVRLGPDGPGEVGTARQGEAGIHGRVGSGPAWQGQVGRGRARQGGYGSARRGEDVMAWHGWARSAGQAR